MTYEPAPLDQPCPHPDRGGRHEVYERGGKVTLKRGGICRACGATELTEFDLIEAVLACVAQHHAAFIDPNTTVHRLAECQNAVFATHEALSRFQEASRALDLKTVTVHRHPPIGHGPKK